MHPWIIGVLCLHLISCLVPRSLLLLQRSITVSCLHCVFRYFFFFSSRRRHTRCGRDWSSDVCSSDLCARCVSSVDCLRNRTDRGPELKSGTASDTSVRLGNRCCNCPYATIRAAILVKGRSEERRVGKECRYGWGAEQA